MSRFINAINAKATGRNYAETWPQELNISIRKMPNITRCVQ